MDKANTEPQVNVFEDMTARPRLYEVARYYMDFLETNFHRRKNPKDQCNIEIKIIY